MARVLQVFRPRTGGTFGHVRVLSSELAARGHEVAVCGPAGEGGGFEVPLYPAPIPRSPSPAIGPAVRAVGSAYRAFAPDLIHAHGAQAGVVARLARAARLRTPLVHTPHRYAFDDGGPTSASHLLYRSLERALMPLATRILCVSEAERRIAQERARLGAERSAAAQARLRQLDKAQRRVAVAKGELASAKSQEQPVDDLKLRSRDIQKELDEIDRMVGVVSETRF